MEVHRENTYREFIAAVRALCREVKMLGGEMA
jgi:hypothetical protein